jgi:hypothetical protein
LPGFIDPFFFFVVPFLSVRIVGVARRDGGVSLRLFVLHHDRRR